MMNAPTPVQRLFFEWQAVAHAADNAPPEMPDAELEALNTRAFSIADDIMELPSEGVLDFMCKLVAYTFDGKHDISDGAKGYLLWAEARRYVPQEGKA